MSDDCAQAEPGKPDCREAVEELYVFLDGQLDDERRALIQGHLDDCGHCLSAFEFHEELKRLVTDRCKSQMPDGLRDRVFAALESIDPA